MHEKIKERLDFFIEKKKYPNILFHGENGTGKITLLNYFIDNIYKNVKNKKDYIMKINCAIDKGIHFIRNELIFFAKTNIYDKNIFKSIILLNADKLTIDAQSALRRCIEVFSKNTRFFMIVVDRTKLMYPILSRFSNIYVYCCKMNIHINKNLHDISKDNIQVDKNKIKHIEKVLNKGSFLVNATYLYENGISGLDIMEYVDVNNDENFDFLIKCDYIRQFIRCEKTILYLFLYLFETRCKYVI